MSRLAGKDQAWESGSTSKISIAKVISTRLWTKGRLWRRMAPPSDRQGVLMRLVVFVSVWLLLAGGAHAEDWPGFRGPSGMGYSNSRLPLVWDGSTGKNVVWKAPLPATTQAGKPDHNQSSPIVCGERVIVTTAFWSDKQAPSDIPEQHVTCYRVADGQQVWDVQVPAGPWKLSDLRGGYCAPTPVTDGQRVYVVFGSSVLAAIDLDGNL